MAVWPATLPQLPEKSSYNRGVRSNLIRSSMDTGPAKVRRRGATKPKTISVGYVMSKEQLDIFEEFFENDIGFGSLQFTFPDPEAGADLTVRFLGDDQIYGVVEFAPSRWTLSFQLEILIV